MNRIYLFLFALLAASGLTANAYEYRDGSGITTSNLKLSVESGTKDWDVIELEEFDSYQVRILSFSPKIDNPKISIQGDWKQTDGNEYGKVYYKSKDTLKNKNGIGLHRHRYDGYGTLKTMDADKYDSSDPDEISTNLSKDKYYLVYFQPKSDNNYWLYIEETSNTGDTDSGKETYWLYADMNRWSIYKQSEAFSPSVNEPKKVAVYPVGTKDSDKNADHDKAEQVFGGKDNIPRYLTKEELDKDWKFTYVDENSKFAIANTIKGNDGWYYLDFSNKRDAEGNVGRICGQFQITHSGLWDGDRWGYNAGSGTNPQTYLDNIDYMTHGVKTGEAFTAHYGGGQNLQLADSYIVADEDGIGPIMYFNPKKNLIYIKGKGVKKYVYYTVIGGTAAQPETWNLEDQSQDNYFANTIGFNPNPKDAKYNPGSLYNWERLSADHPDAKYGTVTYRRIIPSGAIHRFPTDFLVSVTDADGTFGAREIGCDDVWFIRAKAEVNLHFRYANPSTTQRLSWVCYNAFNKYYEGGLIAGYNYLFGGQKAYADEQPAVHTGDWGAMTYGEITTGTHKGEFWWSTPLKMPAEFSANAWAMFADSRGGIFPSDRVLADEEDLVNLQITGKDIWYEVQRKENGSLSILYSHLNGTYSLQTNGAQFDNHEPESIQINAEFFLPDDEKDLTHFDNTNDDFSFVSGDLLTHTGLVTYSFDIYKDRSRIDGIGYQEKPYYEWITKDLSDGYYYIVVKAKYGDKVYTSEDTYVIYK